jgi:chromosome segregation ATPase
MKDGARQFKFAVLISLFVMMSVCPGTAQGRQSLSTDEFLEYSLEALRSKMNEAVEANRQISARNVSIRNRVLFLREEMRKFDDDLIKLKEQAIDLRNAIRLDAAELKLEEKQVNNLLERKRHLDFERDLLKKRMETSSLERGLLEQGVNETAFDIRELAGSVKGSTTSQLLNYFAEEKLKFLDMLKGYQIRIADAQSRFDAEELLAAGHLRAKETALREKERLESQISEWDLRLKEESARADLLKREAERVQQDTRENRLAMEKGNFEKKEYRKQLTIVIQDFKAARQDFQKQCVKDEQELQRQIALLKEENQALFYYKKILENQLRLSQVKDGEEHTTLLVTQQQLDLDRNKQDLVNEVNQARTAFANQASVNASLARDEERLTKELGDLTARVEQVKQSAAVIREDAFGQKKAALDMAFQEQSMRMQKLEQDIEAVELDLQRQKDLLLAEQNRTNDLEKVLAEGADRLKELEKNNGLLLQEQKALSLAAIDKLSSFKKSIADARLSKRAMEASYDVIQKKYQAGEYEVKAFEAERGELNRYFDVLKNENKGLQKRLAELKKR